MDNCEESQISSISVMTHAENLILVSCNSTKSPPHLVCGKGQVARRLSAMGVEKAVVVVE